ncbi:MAG: VOC family protein [Candidatus Saccharimonadales bacterium]
MPTKLNPYIGFNGNAREAMEFYNSVFGGDLTMGTFKESNASQDPSEDDLIMHSALEAGNITLMGSDTPRRMKYEPGTNISISLIGEDEAELTGYFEKLSEGGKITMPLAKAGWGDTFGMCTDKFNTQWLVNITAPKEDQKEV